MERWRAFAVVGCVVATLVGCSGKSDHHGSGAPQDAAGQGGGAGTAGSTRTGGSAGKSSAADAGGSGGSAGGNAGDEGGNGDGNLGGSGGAGRGGSAGSGGFSGSGAGGFVAAGAGGGYAGNAGAAGSRNVPIEWGCARSTYGDGTCDCGCGAFDVDCSKADVALCGTCNLLGSCNRDECPGRIDPDDITTCLAPPKEWICSPAAYGDGKVCDCGCGAQDLDCPDTKLSSCDSCQTVGSCSFSACPGKLSPDDNSVCYVPPQWTCDAFYYGDGKCTCGCGARDVDCADGDASSCEDCRGACACNDILASDNAYCAHAPGSWTCAERLYHDGSNCDCGCGEIDPDCAGSGVDACDSCDSTGSCSVLACPGLIDTDHNDICTRPTPPDGWLCYEGAYGDAYCDCGCGVLDIDCLGSSANLCEHCGRCSGSCDNLDPNDPLQCKPPPSGWTCDESHYFDYQCDCGCGIPDPWCSGGSDIYSCTEYPEEGCSGGNKALINKAHNERCTVTIPSTWTCVRAYYDDGLCDCGCGVSDPDCSSKLVGACANCSGQGSCSSITCPGTINPTDNTRCTN